MQDSFVSFRNTFFHFLYTRILKNIFFLLPPEVIHDRMTDIGSLMGTFAFTRNVTSILLGYQHPYLEQTLLGIHFKNPIGLAAGFDKNARLTDILPAVGFGYEEIGSITAYPCEGNPKPRLWRLKKSKSLIVHYGLMNDGANIIYNRLKQKSFQYPLGISIAKTNSKETVDMKAGIADYVFTYTLFKDIGSYFTINISCPNAYGGQPFVDNISYEELLKGLAKIKVKKPVFIKLSPDLSKKQIDDIIEISERYKVDGFICSNLTKNRNNKKILEKDLPINGGLSGKVVEDLANELISYVYKKTKGKYLIIGCGGIFSAADAYKKIQLGASLLQLITGMIFEGPEIISEINRGIIQLLKKDGYTHISQAVGRAQKN